MSPISSFSSKDRLGQTTLDGMNVYLSRFAERPYERFDFYDTADFSFYRGGAVLYVHEGKLTYADEETVCGASLKETDKPVCVGTVNTSPLKKLLAQKIGEEALQHITTVSFRVTSFSIVEDKKRYTIRARERQSANSRADWFYQLDSDDSEAMQTLGKILTEKGFAPCSFHKYLLSFVQTETKGLDAENKAPESKAENSFFKYVARQADAALESFSKTGDMDSLLAGSASIKALLLPKPHLYDAEKTVDFAQKLWNCARVLSGISLLENAGVSDEGLLSAIDKQREKYSKRLAELKLPDTEDVSLPENADELLGERLKKMRSKLKKAFKKAKKERSMKNFAALCPLALDAVCNISFIGGEAVSFSAWRTLFSMMLLADLKKSFKDHADTIKFLIPAPTGGEINIALKNTRKLLKQLKKQQKET